MKALFVFHDQMWAGYNVGWSKKAWAGLRPHAISNHDLGWIPYTLPPASVTSVRYQSNRMWMLRFLVVLQFDTTSSQFPFFFHFCIFRNSREFLKFETQYSVFFPYSHLIFPPFFYPLMKLKATQTVCTGFNQWFIDFLHIGPLSFGCLWTHKLVFKCLQAETM